MGRLQCTRSLNQTDNYDQQIVFARGFDQKNIYGEQLEICSMNPVTGWYRDGFARTDENDFGSHTVCATMTEEFLAYTKRQGNDLSTPNSHFPGLKPGDRWALCASRWLEAFQVKKAPLVKLKATNFKALDIVTLSQLEERDDKKFGHSEL